MKEGDDRMLESSCCVVTEILEAGVIHEGARGIVHLPPPAASVSLCNTILLCLGEMQ